MKTKLPRGFWKSTVALAVPIALQNLLISCGSIVDTAMIVPLGDTAVAALGVAGRFTFMLNLIAFGFASGLSTLISQFWGVKDENGIRRSYGLALSVSIIISIIYMLVTGFFTSQCISIFGPASDVAAEAYSYLKVLAFAYPFIMYCQISCSALRATEKVSVPLFSSLLGVCANSVLNYILIWGKLGLPKLGVKGAAIATLTTSILQAIIVFCFVNFGKNVLKAKISSYFSFGKEFIKKYFSAAAPVLLNEIMWGVGTNIYVCVLARQATSDFAAYSIYETIQQLFFAFFVGVCNASAIMVGKACGKGDFDNAYKMAKAYLIMTPCGGVVLGAMLILARDFLVSLFSIQTAQTTETVLAIIGFYGCWIGFRMIPYTSVVGIFRAGGDTVTGCVYEISCMYLFAIPVVCICGLWLKIPFLYLIMAMFVSEDLPKAVLCLTHFFRKKWMHKLTDDVINE